MFQRPPDIPLIRHTLVLGLCLDCLEQGCWRPHVDRDRLGGELEAGRGHGRKIEVRQVGLADECFGLGVSREGWREFFYSGRSSFLHGPGADRADPGLIINQAEDERNEDRTALKGVSDGKVAVLPCRMGEVGRHKTP